MGQKLRDKKGQKTSWPTPPVEYGHRMVKCARRQAPILPLRNAADEILFCSGIMIFLECGVIALFEAFYMFRDHNHFKMKL